MNNLNLKKSNLKNNSRLCLYSLSLFVSTTLILLHIPFAYYLFLLVSGYLLLALILKSLKPIERILLSPFPSTIILIIYGALLDIIGIPINKISVWFGISLIISIILVLSYSNPKKIKFQIPKVSQIEEYIKKNIFDLLALVYVIAIIIGKVVSVWGYSTPIMHDPIAHATWTLQMVEEGAINYFYSPGLHIISAFGQILGGFFAPKQILIITNFYNAIFGVTAYIWIKKQFKNNKSNNWWALLSLVMLTVGQYPTKLFYSAGKNGLIMAGPYLFLFFITLNIKDKTKKFLLGNIVLIALTLIHYPTAFFAYVFLFAYLIVTSKKFKEKISNALKFIPSGIFGLLWAFLKYPYRASDIERVVSNSESVRMSLFEAFKYMMDASAGHWYVKYMRYHIFWVGVIGCLIFLVKSTKNKKYLWVSLGSIIIFTISLVFVSLGLSSFDLIPRTAYVLSFIPMYLCVAFLLSDLVIPYILKYSKIFETIGFVLMTGFMGVMSIFMYRNFYAVQGGANLVTENEEAVFEWIDQNLDDDVKILNVAYRHETKPDLVFQPDAGAWLTVYTENPIAMPFNEFWSVRTHELYDIYAELYEDPSKCNLVDEFNEEGYDYYFVGSKQVFAKDGQARLDIDQEDLDRGYYELVYQSGDAKLYRLIGCE